MIPENEYLERVVAGIHAVAATDAEVTWNEIINGRQFDVTVRFDVDRVGYLVVVEVRNRKRKASVSDMDAFVTKARDQGASRAIFVTAAGFQRGALEVAKKHGVELFRVAFDHAQARLPANGSYIVLSKAPTRPPMLGEFSVGEPILVTQIEAVTLTYVDGTRHNLPDEQSQMAYYATKTLVGRRKTLAQILEGMLPASVELGRREFARVGFWLGRHVEPPDQHFFPSGRLSAIECTLVGSHARPVCGDSRIEPSALQSPVIYTNAFTNEATSFELSQLPLGMGTAKQGQFYFMACPLRYFYCKKIEDGLITWEMIESYQSAQLIRCRYTQLDKYAGQYIPVRDTNILKRLRLRLKEYHALERARTRMLSTI